MMQVKIKFFAVARDAAGRDECLLTLPEGSSVSTALDRIIDQYPQLKKWKEHLAIAVNLNYVSREDVLHPDDEIAVIPPVSGG